MTYSNITEKINIIVWYIVKSYLVLKRKEKINSIVVLLKSLEY